MSEDKFNYVLMSVAILLVIGISFFYKPAPTPPRLTLIESVIIKSYSIGDNPLCQPFDCPETKRLFLTTTDNKPYSLPLTFKDDPLIANESEYSMKFNKALSEGDLTLKYYKMDNFTCAYGLYDSKGNAVYDLSEIYKKFVSGDFTNSLRESWVELLSTLTPSEYIPVSKYRVDNVCYKYKTSLLLDEAH